jgi:hypothetical protein
MTRHSVVALRFLFARFATRCIGLWLGGTRAEENVVYLQGAYPRIAVYNRQYLWVANTAMFR